MARRTTRKMTPRRKMARRYRRKANKAIQKMGYLGGPFPKEFVTKLTYGDDQNVTVTSGVPNTYSFTMNGLFDPNLTGTGHQPRYYDTLCGATGTATPYSAYVVFASKIKVIAIPASSTSDTFGMRSLVALSYVPLGVAAPVSLPEILERTGDTKYKYCGYWNSGTDHAILKAYKKVAPILGVKDPTDDTGCKAAYNANPSNLATWDITLAPMNQTQTVVFTLAVRITYYVKFYNLNDVADS